MEEDFRAGFASAIEGIATNIVVYILFTVLGILTENPFLTRWTNTDFIHWFIIILVIILLVEILMDLVNAIISASYALGLIVGGIIILVFFGEITNIVIGFLGVLLRISIEILKQYESYPPWF